MLMWNGSACGDGAERWASQCRKRPLVEVSPSSFLSDSGHWSKAHLFIQPSFPWARSLVIVNKTALVLICTE